MRQSWEPSVFDVLKALDRAGGGGPLQVAIERRPLSEVAPDARAGKPPCGECHLRPGETCDICGASQPARVSKLSEESFDRTTLRFGEALKRLADK